MERPLFKPVGTAVEDLDTPALVLDLALLERNITTLHDFFRQHAAKVRPVVEPHRCPAIAHKQLDAGGTVEGICVTTIGQAEVFTRHGFRDVLIASPIVTPQKIARLCALARHAKLTVAVDQPQNVQDLSNAARTLGVILHIVVEIYTRGNRCGVDPGQPAVDLAQQVQQAPSLEFDGLMSREGPTPGEDPAKVVAESGPWIQQVVETRHMVESAGIPVRSVCVGGTYNYESAGAVAGVTEILAGTYALMDSRHRQCCPQFKPAARVLSTVTSRPEPATAIVDAGQKAVGIDTGLPVCEDLDGVRVLALNAEHGRLQLQGGAEAKVAPGDKVWLTPWDIGTCVNLYDYIHAVRDGKLEAVWEVAARGRYR